MSDSRRASLAPGGGNDRVFALAIDGDEGDSGLAGDGAHVRDIDSGDFQFLPVGGAFGIGAYRAEEDDSAPLSRGGERLIGSLSPPVKIRLLRRDGFPGHGEVRDPRDPVDIE